MKSRMPHVYVVNAVRAVAEAEADDTDSSRV